jgi:hypothetical protein
MKTPTESKRLETAAKVAALTLANAMIFQEQLALSNSRVEPLRKFLRSTDLVSRLAAHWSFICSAINYIPIFSIARDILTALPAGPALNSAIEHLTTQALSISSRRAALRHDLMGRIYHFLLHDAKYLGTYYTSVSAATLLLKLTLDPNKWDTDWSEVSSIRDLTIGDLACGTGTLLMAASQAVTDNFIRARAAAGKPVTKDSLRDLHRALMEDMLHGYDVLPSAVHLTAATLGLLAPEIAFRKMQLYGLPLGKSEDGTIHLGSIDYFIDATIQTQLDLMGGRAIDGPEAITGKGAKKTDAPVPSLSLCVMNPPFVRSVGGNLLFGSLARDRAEMQQELRRRLRVSTGLEALANITAGLCSVFAAVGDRRLSPNGTLSLVIPAAITTGIAWEKTRRLIDRDYELDFVVVSHDPERWSFSENTSLSEVLLVARKRPGAPEAEHQTVFVNLWRNPRTIVEAQSTADAILKTEPAPLGNARQVENGVVPLYVAGRQTGELLQITTAALRGGPWIGGAFAQTDLNRAAWYLRASVLVVPHAPPFRIKMCRLDSLFSIGPDRRDVYDAFAESDGKTPYAAFWSHNAGEVRTIAVKPNRWLSPLSRARKGRTLRRLDLVWPRAGRLMVAERMRLSTQRLVSVVLAKPALSNVWWPVRSNTKNERLERIISYWLNSTLGLLVLCAHRTPTEGPWVQFKKPALEALPILDLSSVPRARLTALDKRLKRLEGKPLEPIQAMGSDTVRDLIDRAFHDVLGMPNLTPLRTLLSVEPIISDRSLVPIAPTEAEAEASLEQLDLL